MRTIVHLSDLHFGRVQEGIVEALSRAVHEIQPDLIAVSGDLTQRARREQFEQARDFLRTLPDPKIIVPGNHDVPLYNIFNRFTRPLKRYKRYISEELEPFYRDNEIAAQGLNTARSLTFTRGRVNERQIGVLQQRLAPLKNVTKVVITHHPFDLPEQYPDQALVGRARMALRQLANSGIDLFLAGHLHVGIMEKMTLRFQIAGHSALVVQAGTATSSRTRGETNSFNVIRVRPRTIIIERFDCVAADRAFRLLTTATFEHTETGWMRKQDAGTSASLV
ncbi:MAG TPA: metallophosphoesterase [Candidatus Binatia bacterium]|nr:metallophosphoesterase [Candidatus Binatia bacterium]